MNNKPGFLTVRKFAEQRGITLHTVYKWIREGKLPEVVKHYGEVTYIPESYLTLEIDRKPSGRPEGSGRPIPKLLSKEERFNRTKRIPFSLSELEQLLNEGKTFREIGDMAGVSYQAISHLYKHHFEHLMPTGWERRKAIINEQWKQKGKTYLDGIEHLSIIAEEAKKVGYEVEPIEKESIRGWHKDKILINGKICRVYHPKVPGSTSEDSNRLYYRISLSRSPLLKCDFLIALVGEGPYDIFIFPSGDILDQFGEGKHHKMLYIPSEYQDPYNNQYPKIDWWDYQQAWGRLQER